MRSSGSETSVGLLLFDEPSASLDPTAEHGMYWFQSSFVFHTDEVIQQISLSDSDFSVAKRL